MSVITPLVSAHVCTGTTGTAVVGPRGTLSTGGAVSGARVPTTACDVTHAVWQVKYMPG